MSDLFENEVPSDLDVSSIYSSNYLKAADLPDGFRRAAVIERVTVDEMPARDGKPARKRLAVHLRGARKPLPLNVTNQSVLAAALGTKPAKWPGASVTIVRTTCAYGGQIVPAIRIEGVRRAEPAAAVPPPAPAEFVATDVPF